MYKRHKTAGIMLFVTVFFLSFLLSAKYSSIDELAISVISIALAVYIGAASMLLGSNFAEKLKKYQDEQIPTKTSLGVLSTYLRIAGFCGLATIAISTVYVLDLDISFIRNTFAQWQYWNLIMDIFLQLLSSVACALFAINIFYIWLILIFLINSMTKSV